MSYKKKHRGALLKVLLLRCEKCSKARHEMIQFDVADLSVINIMKDLYD
jgi:hypothetical protein